MLNEIDQLLDSAIIKIRHKIMPQAMTAQPSMYTQEPTYHILYPLLDIWDKDRLDEDIEKKTQYIYDYLDTHKENNTIKDTLVDILTKIGITPPTETRLERIYKYCKLRKQAESIMREFEYIEREINAFSNNRR